ncbi:MAG: c-type cytochrome biogenesis protein CcmI [Gallionellaceae bacterium]
MTSFSIISALLLVVAVLFVVLPLWRSKVKNNQVLRNSANLEIFRDQIAEMDNDLRNGLLTQELYDQGKRELQARLLEEVNGPEGAVGTVKRNPHKSLALVLAVALPLLAIGLYWKIGNRDALLPPGSVSGQGMTGAAQSDAALKNLEGKLAVNPKDTDSLEALARLYAGMGRYGDAAMTYNKLTKLVTQNAQLWADFADALAMASGQKLAGHPTLLIKTALALDPNNPKALALAGAAAMEIGEYPAAIQYWEKLLKIIPKDTENAKMFADGIQQARMAMAQGKGSKQMAPGQAPVASGQERITGTVTISDAMKGKVSPDDMLFVLARAESGPPMPLAVMRRQVKDLPMQFELNDSMAMAPQMKLSDFDKVVVVARVAKSGDPMPHPGDIQGMSTTIKPGTSGVKVSIDSEVK